MFISIFQHVLHGKNNEIIVNTNTIKNFCVCQNNQEDCTEIIFNYINEKNINYERYYGNSGKIKANERFEQLKLFLKVEH